MWSDGVKQHENDKLENVDKAVISGIPRVSTLFLIFEFGNTKFIEYVLFWEQEILIVFHSSFANTAKGWVLPFDATLRAARGFTTSPAQQPVDPSSP